MFWNFHFNSSGIDTLLAKEDVTVTQILDEEDILQECKTQNTKLLDFLIEDGNLKQLLHFVVDDPPEDEEDTLKYKFKNLACEVLIIDAYSMLDKIANNEEFLDILWSLIERPPPLNPLIASFFSKLFSLLVCRKPDELLDYMKKHDAVNKLIVHIEISAIMTLFLKMVTIVETQEKKLELTKWLDEESFIQKVIELLKSSEKEEKHDNISQLLSELIKIGRDSISQYTEVEDPLLLTLEKKETMECLVKTMLEDRDGANSDSSIMAGVATFLSMMEVTRPVIEGMEEIITQNDLERIADGVRATAEVLADNMQGFYQILSQPSVHGTMETTFGKLNPPLGKVRLSIVSLVATCSQLNSKIMNDAIAKTKLLNCMLELFGQYEWHNFLHGHVQNCVVGILNTSIGDENGEETTSTESADILLKHLFTDSNIVGWCISLWNKNITAELNCSNGRKGYMGHLTVIMNEIVNAKEKGSNHEIVMSMFNDLPQETRDEWNNIVSTSLAETNEKNMITPLNSQGYADSESSGEICDFEGNPIGKRTNISLYDGTLQQAFENYQVQPMTNEFIESFGYDEANIDDTDNLKNPFDEVGNIDISINANEESENERLFESICEQKIKPFDDSEDEDEDDLWEEKQLTFTTGEPRQSADAIKSDSSDEDEDNDKYKDEKVDITWPSTSSDTNKEDDKMDIDNDSNDSNKGWWQADFSQMDVQGSHSNESSNWANPSSGSETVLSSSGENFANFTDISKFAISGESENSNLPTAMETDGSVKSASSSPYEVKMEEDTSNSKTETETETKKPVSQITQITVKSVIASPETPDNKIQGDENQIVTENKPKSEKLNQVEPPTDKTKAKQENTEDSVEKKMVNDSDTQKISDNNESSGQTSSAEVSSANKEAEAVLEQPKSKIEGDVSPTTNNSDKTTPANESSTQMT